jgi:hypothetical protein
MAISPIFSTPCRGQFVYITNAGVEYMIAIAGKTIYQIDAAAGEKTVLGTLVSDNECYAVNAAGKLWIVNGEDFVKIEDDLSVSRVQIEAPVNATMNNWAAGGTLPEGARDVYVAYARVVDGQYLHSLPQLIGTITLATGNQTVSIQCAASADPQVTHVVVFMTDAAGVVPYFFGAFANDGSEIVIVDESQRNEFILMNTVSAANQALPITPSGIFTFNDRLFVWDINKNTLFWSLKTDVNAFDLERFLPENFRVVSHSINSVFSIGENLYINSIGNGVSVIVNGDMSSVIKHIDRAHWFLDVKTPEGKSNVINHRGSVFGLTNDGFRFYNGGNTVENYTENFSDDVSFHIKPDVNMIYTTAGNCLPSAIVNRRSGKRTEYRFSFCNLEYGNASNNDQLIFNLDFYFASAGKTRTWERWENGFMQQCVINNTWFGVQTGADGQSQIVRESGTADINCYDRTGTFQTVLFLKQFYVNSRTFLNAIDGVTIWGPPYAFATCAVAITGRLVMFDVSNTKYAFTIPATPEIGAPLPAELPFVMLPQYPVNSSDPVAFGCRSNTIALELSQVADDPSLFVFQVQLPRAKEEKNNLT